MKFYSHKSNIMKKNISGNATLIAIFIVVALSAIPMIIWYTKIRQSCETQQVQSTLRSLLEDQVMQRNKHDLEANDFDYQVKNIISTGNSGDINSCQSDLIIKFSDPIANTINFVLAETSKSKKDPTDIFTTYLILKPLFEKHWNEATHELTINLNYSYVKDTVRVGGGLEGLRIAQISELFAYIGKLKAESSAKVEAPAEEPEVNEQQSEEQEVPEKPKNKNDILSAPSSSSR